MPSTEPERPRTEPEIIPPDRFAGEEPRREPPHDGYERYTGYAHERSTRRIYIGRIGPLGMAFAALLGLALAVLLLALLLGAFLIAIPIAALVVGGTLIAGLFCRLFRQR